MKQKMHLDSPFESSQINEWMYQSFTDTDEGYLKGRAIVTNIGIFPYLVDGRIENRLRTPDEVLRGESLDSLRMVPLTNEHPSVPVDAENIKDYQVGHLGTDIRIDGYSVSADIIITDPETIKMVKDGKVALSCGYFSDIEDKSGNEYGQPYDSVQTNIRYNHVSIVDAGRAGDAAKMFVDHQDTYICGLNAQDKKEKPQEEKVVDTKVNDTKEKNMRKIMVDNKEIEVQKDAADEILTIVKDRDTFKADKAELETTVTTLEAQADGYKDEIKKAKDEKKAIEDSMENLIASGVDARANVTAVAAKLEVSFDSKDNNITIKKKVVLSQVDNKDEISAKMEDKGEVYVDARFDQIAESIQDTEDTDAENGKAVLDADGKEEAESKEGKEVTADSARQTYMDSILKKEGK